MLHLPTALSPIAIHDPFASHAVVRRTANNDEEKQNVPSSNSWSPGLADAAQWSKTKATVIRDSDFLRAGIKGHASEVSSSHVELMLASPVDLAEHVAVELENVLQRVKVHVRATVECIEEQEDGWFRMAGSLLTRLAPRDVQGLSSMKVQGGADQLSVSDFLKRHLP